jgi:hypothetical protein
MVYFGAEKLKDLEVQVSPPRVATPSSSSPCIIVLLHAPTPLPLALHAPSPLHQPRPCPHPHRHDEIGGVLLAPQPRDPM